MFFFSQCVSFPLKQKHNVPLAANIGIEYCIICRLKEVLI